MPADPDRRRASTHNSTRIPPRAWMFPWLRINLLIRDMTAAFHVREARQVLKVEITRAVAMREKMKRGVWWN